MPDTHPQSRRIDHTSLALGEMREFMTHHRQQMDKVNERLMEHSDSLKHLRHDQEKQMLIHDQTRQDVGDIKVSLSALCEQQKKRKISRPALVKGFGYGVAAMTVFAAIYYKDSELIEILYRHTIGIIV